MRQFIFVDSFRFDGDYLFVKPYFPEPDPADYVENTTTSNNEVVVKQACFLEHAKTGRVLFPQLVKGYFTIDLRTNAEVFFDLACRIVSVLSAGGFVDSIPPLLTMAAVKTLLKAYLDDNEARADIDQVEFVWGGNKKLLLDFLGAEEGQDSNCLRLYQLGLENKLVKKKLDTLSVPNSDWWRSVSVSALLRLHLDYLFYNNHHLLLKVSTGGGGRIESIISRFLVASRQPYSRYWEFPGIPNFDNDDDEETRGEPEYKASLQQERNKFPVLRLLNNRDFYSEDG